MPVSVTLIPWHHTHYFDVDTFRNLSKVSNCNVDQLLCRLQKHCTRYR